MTRVCSMCNTSKRKVGYSYCLNCRRVMDRKRYERNREFVWGYLEKNPCIDCGEQDPIVLEFDHILQEDKSHNVSRMMGGSWSLERIKKEIDKCEVRCANCHRRRTHKQLKHLYKI